MAWAQCDVLSSQVYLSETNTYSRSNKGFIVKIHLLVDGDTLCPNLSSTLAYKYNLSCGIQGEKQANLLSTVLVSNSKHDCTPKTGYTNYGLRRYTFVDTLQLGTSSHCDSMIVYVTNSSASFKNLDTNLTDIQSWVKIYLGHRNHFAQSDTTLNVLEACVGQTRHFQPIIHNPDRDSIFIKWDRPQIYSTQSSLPFQLQFHNFSFPYTASAPMASFGLSIDTSTISFTGYSEGLYTLPLLVEEWTRKSGAIWGRKLKSTTYRQQAIYLSDSCYYSQQNFKVFEKDSLNLKCSDRVIHIPLHKKILASSINRDGSDFKFSNTNGFPIVVNKVDYDATQLFVDEVFIHLRFFFDGIYRAYIVSGSDANTIINECGYELQESELLKLYLSSCPNEVSLGQNEYQTLISVFPNPIANQFKITHQGSLKNLKMFDGTGAEVSVECTVSPNTTTITGNFKPGVYLVLLQLNDGSRVTKKLIKI